MNFVGKFDGSLPVEGAGLHPKGQVHVDSVSGHAPSNAIVVQDAHLLFTGDYKRAGVDLVISKDGHELVVPDYFKGEKRAALASPDGAHLTGDIVNALTGHTQFAQADGSASAAKVIGHVTKLVGNATVVRNGVAVVLNLGDNVNQGDVVQSGSNSTLGITFIDGSVFGLGSNAKMVLNEMIYDPNGSSNSSLLSLVQGTISFVAGATAKHGDMKVDTPVATMGIRGTAVLVEIDFEVPGSGVAPPARFQVLVEPDGTTGNYVLLDKITLLPIATVSQAGMQTIVNGQGGVSVSSAQLSQEAQDIIKQVFSLKFANSDPNTNTHFTDTVVPETKFLQFATGQEVLVKIVTIDFSGTTATGTTSGPAGSFDHIPGPPAVVTSDATLSERSATTGSLQTDKVTGSISYQDTNAGDVPSVKTSFTSFKYQDAGGHDVTATLTASQRAAIEAVEVALVVQQDPNQKNFGTATWTYNVADHSLDFLAAGETLTLTYTAEVDNNYALNNEKTFKTFTVTVTGTNDLPVIATGPQSVALAADKTAGGGVLVPLNNNPTAGSLVFTDTDLTDTHTVSTRLVSADFPGSTVPLASLSLFETALSAQIAADSTFSGTGRIDWQFADLPVRAAGFIPPNETLTLTYEVTVRDSQGATSTQVVTVTIKGVEVPAVVWVATTSGESSGGLWSTALNWETGTVPTATDDVIIMTDQLRGLEPSYPVTIDAATHAVAKTLTMNDFSTSGTAHPRLVNLGELTVSGEFDLIRDSIVENAGVLNIGGRIEILGASALTNAGTLNLDLGGDFKDTSSVTNFAGGVIDLRGGTLNDFVAILNDGLITIENGARLVMNGGSITGGVLHNLGTIEIAGNSSINDDDLTNTQLTVDAGKTLTLGQTTISGGIVDNAGIIEATSGVSTIQNLAALHNDGTLQAVAGGTLKLAGLTVSNINGTINVGAGSTLDLMDAGISGGDLTNAGMIESLAGDNVISAAVTNAGAGTIEIFAGSSLTIAGTVTGDGAIQIDDGALLRLDATLSDAQRIIFDGAGSSELQIDASSLVGSGLGGTIAGLGATDRLDLTTIVYDATTTAVYSAITGVLTVTDGYGGSVSMTLVGDYTNAHFAGSNDGANHLLITLNAADDAPVIAAADKAESASVAELPATTGATTTDLSVPASGTIHFTDIDLTDRPTAAITAQTVTWTGGTLSQAQIDALAHGLSLVPVTNTNNGAVTWTYAVTDKELDFIGDGQTVTVTSTITVDDGQGRTDTATVTVTLVGSDDAPVIAGDLAIQTVKGGSVKLAGMPTALSTADLQAVDPDNGPEQLTYTVTAISHGHLASTANGQAITSFTQADINNGSVYFVADSTNPDGTLYVGGGSFTVTLSDGVPGTATATATVDVAIVDAQLSVLTGAGFDFNQDDPVGAIGGGTVSGVTSTSFTITNAAADRVFIFTGSGFDYSAGAFTGGIITSILETDAAGHPLASFGLHVSIIDWMAAAIAKASGDSSLIEAMTGAWTVNFIGNGGPDAFASGGQNDIFTGRAGNDTLSGGFGYDRASYGSATGGIDVQLADGIVTGDSSVGTDTLRSIELVTGSNYADTFNAVGFSATSSNAGSLVTANTAGLFNEFEGRGGDDSITGNGWTRISYAHATSGVVVVFDGHSWDPAFNPAGGASGTAVGDASVGTDTFTGVYSVRGSNFADSFTGSSNPAGTAENFEGLGGDDVIDGGGGFDRAVYNAAHDGAGITVELAAGTVTGGPDTGTDTLRSVEAIWGTDFADTYDATGFSTSSTNAGSIVNASGVAYNEFEGGGGDDTVIGNGNTRIVYSHATGGVVVTLGSGGSGESFGNSSTGHDQFSGGVNAVAGSEFNDILTGNGDNNVLDGRGGNDVLIGNGGNDSLTGGAGSDIFVFKVGTTDSNNPPGNNDTVTDFSHGEGDRIDLRSVSGVNNLADLLSHGAQQGSDAVFTFGGATTLTLKNVTMADLTASDFIFAGQIAVTVQTTGGYDLNTLYEMKASGPFQPANDANHIFLVDAAKGITFELIGNGIYDTTTHLPTSGLITEINILDTTDPSQTTQDHVLVNTNGWSIDAAALFDAVGPIHNGNTTTLDAILGAASYSIVGSNGVSVADNRFGSGADVFFGGDHPDVFNGLSDPAGSGGDTVDYSHAGAGLTASLLNPASNTGAAAGDIYISIENLRGTAFDDTLIGDGGDNVLEGGPGNDFLDGQGGHNTASYAHAASGVTVDLSLSGAQDTQGAGTDTLVNISNLTGSRFADTLKGDSTDNVLSGNGGNDVLFGGGGNDTFVFNATMNHVTIEDFTAGHDHIQLNFAVPFAANDATSFQNWAMSHIAQQNGDTLITFDQADTILLKNVSMASLHGSDFILPSHA